MTLSGLWTRKSSPKESQPPPSPPSDVHENPWTQLKSKLRSRRGHETADRTTSPDAKVSAKTPTDHRKRDLLFQIISPRPSVHPPRSSTTSSPSRENAPAPTSAVYSSSYRQVSQDSPFALLYECEHVSVAPTRAQTFGVVPSADFHALDLDSEDNAGEPVEARPLQQFATVPFANTETTPLSELSPAFASDSSNASPRNGCELANGVYGLKPIELASSSKTSPTPTFLSKTLMFSTWLLRPRQDPSLPMVTRVLADLTNLPALTSCYQSGPGDYSGSFSAAAPVPSDKCLNEESSESIVHIAPADVQVTTQPPELHESADTETMNFHPRSRDSVASSSSYHSLFEYDDIVSDRPLDAENPPPSFNVAEDSDVDAGRSLYDPVLQCFYLPPKVNKVGSAGNEARNTDKERIESAGVKAESLAVAAPVPSTRVSGSENCKLVIRVTPPTPPVTMRPTYLQTNPSIHAGEVNFQNYLVPPNPRRSKSRANSDHLGFGSGETDVLAAAPSAENDSKVGTGSVEIRHGAVTAHVRSDTRFTSHHLRTIQTFGSSATLVDQLPSPAEINILRASDLTGDDVDLVDGEDVGAGDEAEPSSSDAPIPSASVPRRKPREANGFAGGFLPSRVHQHPRTFKSRIACSLREWGNAVSRLFTAQRPANVGETQNFSPSFDPWEQGYIPPRGPSPDLAEPGVDFGPPQPSIQNVYVKLD